MLRAFLLVELCMSVLVTGDTNSLSHHSDPQEVFDKLPTREASSWNALITGYSKLSHYEGALERGDEKDLRGKVLMKQVMQMWLCASDALLEMMVFHLLSLAKVQRHFVENQYEGLLDDQVNFLPLSKFSHGKVSTGSKVSIMGSNYVPGINKEMYIKSAQRTIIWMGKRQESVEDVPYANTRAMVDLDQYITKNAIKFSVSPVVRVDVQCKVASDLPMLVEGLKRLAKSDPKVVCTIEKSSEHIISGANELHLEICLRVLHEDFMGGAENVFSNPVVSFKEIVLEKSNHTVMSKSPNKHNCLYSEARLIEDLAKKIWCFGPKPTGPNLVVDMCKGVQYLNEIKDSIVAAFQWATKEGALAKENMRGIAFEVCDAVLQNGVSLKATNKGGQFHEEIESNGLWKETLVLGSSLGDMY
ncbi:hypothetical protein L7F22_002554 [Adiantum nelumboides]|nr:hypothetical protein [Adiantum nelumboides]